MKCEKTFQSIVIPAITPLKKDYSLDEVAVENIFASFHRNKVHAFILGTTGEASSLPVELKAAYIKAAARFRQPGTVLYAGISSNCLQESVELAKMSVGAGVDAVVATLPAYYALTDSQMRQYFEQLADSISMPLIIYNIPATTHMSIPLPVIDALSHHPNIAGVKDSERSEERIDGSLYLWKDRTDFSYFLGWAAKSAYALLHEADGLIPSTGNVLPGIYNDMQKAILNNDEEQAYALQRLSDVFGNLYQGGRTLGNSLWALKTLMKSVGLCEAHVMPPLQSGTADEAARLVNEFAALTQKEKV